MLRFCDREISCVEYEALNRNELRAYFLSGHLNEIVCVYDNCCTWEGFRGRITFYSLIQSVDVYDAIQQDYVILDENIWENARTYFKYRKDFNEEASILPVLDSSYQLLCFAYQDKTADRQLRMLRELDEISKAPGFKALYPEYDCVEIHGCNELAYALAEYLRKRNIPVILKGSMWEYFENMCGELQDQGEYETLEYLKFKIHAEGILQAKKKLLPDVLQSVAPEFECVDQMYETCIQRELIKDAAGNEEWLLEQLRQEQEIVILGVGVESQNAYDYLLGKGIEACCFVSNGQSDGICLGKKILPETEAKEILKNPVFLDCETEHSAWGFGETDRYDCEEYYRNKSFFCLKDYIKIPIGCLPNSLKGKHLVLVGNYNFCCNLNRVLNNVDVGSISYCDVLNECVGKTMELPSIDINAIERDALVLEVAPLYFNGNIKRKKLNYLTALQERGNYNIVTYFSDNKVFMNIQKKGEDKYTAPSLRPGRILFGASGHMCGNSLLLHILDDHPNVIFIEEMFLNNNLCLICMQLAEEQPENMLDSFWKLYEKLEDYTFPMSESDKKIFDDKFEELLTYKDAFTSQELFVILNVAYAAMCGRCVKDIQDLLIYWEPHGAPKDLFIIYEEWLSDRNVKGFSINMIRNSYVRAGSFFKHCESIDKFVYPGLSFFWKAMESPDFSQEEPVNWKRLEVKFETLKTLPKETLFNICKELEIPWSDALLKTTERGKVTSYATKNENISGFDLKPVYNLYEEYFSDFDRFRINLVFADLQKKGDYPYVSCRSFSRRQLYEMFLKEFRFESRLDFKYGESGKIVFRKNLLMKANEYIQRMRRKEILE